MAYLLRIARKSGDPLHLRTAEFLKKRNELEAHFTVRDSASREAAAA